MATPSLNPSSKTIDFVFSKALKNREDQNILDELKEQVIDITKKFPLYE